MARQFPISVNRSIITNNAALLGVKIAQFSDFGLFSIYITPKTYLPVTSLQPRGYIAEWLRFFLVVVEDPKGGLRQRRFPATSGRGAAGTPKLAQSFAYGKLLYPYRMLLHGASDLDQRYLKMRNSKEGCTFPPNTFAPIPQITLKPHFGGPFNAKHIIERALPASP